MVIRHAQTARQLPSWFGRLLFGLVLGLILFCPSRKASAQQWEMPCSAAAATITIPTVTATASSVTVGTLLGSPGTATVTFSCPSSGSGNPWQYFHLNSINGAVTAIYPNYCWWGNGCSNYSSKSIQGVFAGTVTPTQGYNGLVYATNLTGISVLLTNPQPQLTSSGGTISTIAYPTTSTSVTFTAQLIATGSTIQAGTVTSPSQLLTFENYWPGYTNSSPTYGSLTLGNVAVVISACSVNTASQNLVVTLPDVTASTLTSTGATSGLTPFQINLTCNSGATALITMSTASYYGSSSLGVVSPTTGSGYAANVGVQLLQSNGTTPVNFGTAQNLGATPNGTLSIPFYAQYYATGAAGAGNVSATVTFTMSYQ